MAKQENKSKYWIRKWQEKRWSDFKELTVGSIFDTAVSNHVQMADRIGDIIFWYRTDKSKGIYFITKVVAEPKKDDAYQNSWSMSLQVIKTLINNPVLPEKNGFQDLIEKLNKMGQGGANYNLSNDENPEKLWKLVLGNEKVILDKLNIDIDKKDLESIEEIKKQNINDGKMFNPFLDMNLVRNEVRHLSFITNLLNPNGTHHQGVQFLNNFINALIDNYNLDKHIENYLNTFSESENIYVQIEKSIQNGRIDIWIENDEYIIAIEGKTETVDSKGQLKKYDEYLKNKNKPYLLIYLTMTGEEPTNEHPENLQLMDFNDDIMSFIQKSLEINKLPDKIYETLNEYYNAMITYLNNFQNTWTYELDIIYDITKDKESYNKYENIKNNYFYDIAKYKYTVIEDVAKVFEKAKAKIERDFLGDLSDSFDDYLEKEGFIFSSDSMILVNDFPDNVDIDINFDISKIFEKRKSRTASFEKDDIDSIREKSGINLIYSNKTTGLEDEYLRLTILNDIYGLNVYFNHIKNDECINYFEGQHIELLSSNIFHSSNIDGLLDEKYRLKLMDECKEKMIIGLKILDI